MPTFICEKCGCIDNSALGGTFCAAIYDGKEFICHECNLGKWHNYFPKKHWSDYGTVEKILELHKNSYFDFFNVEKFFESST